MKLTTTARHFEASPDLIEHAERRLLKLKRYFDNILNVHLIMSVEKFRHIAEVIVHVNGHDLAAKEESEDMKLSIDRSAKDLERQIKKLKGKILANHQRARRAEPPRESIIRSESVGKKSGVELLEQVPRDVTDYSVEEAIIVMENEKRNFILFNNKESGKLNLAYKRPDGNYGVIETSK
jgi:putative sigma-54 modulation protein